MRSMMRCAVVVSVNVGRDCNKFTRFSTNWLTPCDVLHRHRVEVLLAQRAAPARLSVRGVG